MKFNDVYKKDGEPLLSTFFYDRLAYGLLKFTKQLIITPNQITILSFIMATIAAYYFYINNIIIASLFMAAFFVLDCLDGMTARIKGLTSTFGDFLDHTYGTIFIYIIYFTIAWNLESKVLSFLLLLSIVLYNYVVGITPKNNSVTGTQQTVSKILRAKSSYIGFGFDIQSFIILVGCLTGSLIYGLWLIVFGCLSFSLIRLIITTKGAKND